jgi:hypothetical protein
VKRFDPLLEEKQKKKQKIDCNKMQQKKWFLEACKTIAHEGKKGF